MKEGEATEVVLQEGPEDWFWRQTVEGAIVGDDFAHPVNRS